jgi:cyclomaltodextrinase
MVLRPRSRPAMSLQFKPLQLKQMTSREKTPRMPEAVLRCGLSRIAPALLATLTLAGCLASTPPVRLAEPATIAVRLLLEDASGQREGVPRDVSEALVSGLAARNLRPTVLPPEVAGAEEVRTTSARFASLRAAAPEADFTLLIEARARYFTQIAGRFRWDVDVRLALAGRGAEERPTERSFSAPAHLLFEHEREPEALSAVTRTVVEDAMTLVDAALLADPRAKALQAGGFGARDALYFVMIDRFARPGASRPTTGFPADPDGWHGGTLRGLEARLGWLSDLGVGDVWLSPPFDTRDASFMGHPPWHGYWTEDLLAVEPHFGDEDDLVALAAALKARGLGLWLDLVLNHVGPDAPLAAERPGWFHSPRAIVDWDDPRQLEDGQVHGLPDLDQANPEVALHLAAATAKWLRLLNPEGLRLDAVKHVPAAFWDRFNTNLQATHPGLGRLAEILDGDPLRTEALARAGGFDAIFDFQLHHALLDTFCRDAGAGPLGAALSVNLALDAAARAAGQAPLVRYAFLDNHDLPRVASTCAGDLSRVATALDALVTLPARPSLTWGTEVGLMGASEPDNRAPMRFDPGHPLVGRTRAALLRRSQTPELMTGETRIEAWHGSGVMAFARLTSPDAPATVVAVNPRAAPVRLHLGPHLGLTAIEAAPRAVTTFRTTLLSPPTDSPVEVALRVTGAPPGDLRLAGAGPIFGGWDPRQAPQVGAAPTTLSLAPGRLFALKLVALSPDAPPRWEAGPNRYLFVSGAGPMAVTLAWEEGA